MQEIIWNIRHGVVCMLLWWALSIIPKGKEEREILSAFAVLLNAYMKHDEKTAV